MSKLFAESGNRRRGRREKEAGARARRARARQRRHHPLATGPRLVPPAYRPSPPGLGKSYNSLVRPYVTPPNRDTGRSAAASTTSFPVGERPATPFATWNLTTSASTTAPVLRPVLGSLVSCTARRTHSSCTAASAKRGALTTEEGIGVSPAAAASSVPGGKSPHVWLAASTNHSLMMLTTNSLLGVV
jgi:hypothetical protein